ncbi:MAG: T9SS type A sorting domain-containing protein, partial [Ignavibacteriae bacterium]|nr:T9SS type A sorting domain-containing protein [Ignavibacteriota bacterium]
IEKQFTNTIDSVIDINFLSGAPIPAAVLEDMPFENSIVLYPNPVKNVLLIQSELASKASDRMEIFSLEGKKIMESEYKKTLDVSFLQSGVYILKMNNSSIKFIKE